jgi:spermidine synthase
VEAVELLPQVIRWFEEGLVPLADALGSDARFVMSAGDIFDRLANLPDETADLILIDVDHSPDERLGASSASFYTVHGLQSATRHLAPGGVLAIWSYAESSPFAAALRETFQEVRVEPVTYWNLLADREETDWLFFART